MSESTKLILGTRGSPLALWQSQCVRAELLRRHQHLDIELRHIRTKGDKILDSALSRINDKGLFTREIEQQLLDGRIDFAVHSLKDLPTTLPTGLTIAAVTTREDAADALVAQGGATLDQLPDGAVVLTGSLRRRAQLLHRRPDLRIEDVRGNVQTRLQKFDDSDAHGIVFAAAGLKRSQLDARISQRFAPHDFLPACGQGALAVEIRTDDQSMAALLSDLDDPASRACTTCERTVLAELEGGCQVPIGAFAHVKQDRIDVKAMIADLSGRRLLTADGSGPIDQPGPLGREVAQSLLAQGAAEILNTIRRSS